MTFLKIHHQRTDCLEGELELGSRSSKSSLLSKKESIDVVVVVVVVVVAEQDDVERSLAYWVLEH